MIIHLFGNPSPIGGASTKIADFILMFGREYKIVNYLPREAPDGMATFLSENNIETRPYADFPAYREGVCLAICVIDFFTLKIPQKSREYGIPVVWSNEMMWPFPGEEEAIKEGVVSKVLFLSEIQKNAFDTIYNGTRKQVVGNYVIPEHFKQVDRSHRSKLTIGRLSRPDPLKFPINFPTLYEKLIWKDEKLKVQAWSPELAKIFEWHNFSLDRWTLLEPVAEPANWFLQSIDVFAYPLGHRFIESWGRSTVEAMLTGCVPIVPSGHHLENLMVHGESGFICANDTEFIKWSHALCSDLSLFNKMSRAASEYSRDVVCNKTRCCEQWKEALEDWK